MMTRRAQQRSRHRGAVSVELALLALPLLFMMLAAIEFGRVVVVYQQLDKAARTAARYLAIVDPLDPMSSTPAASAEYLSAISSAKSLMVAAGIPGLTESMITVCDQVNACTGFTATRDIVYSGTTMGQLNLVQVRIDNYQFKSAFAMTRVLLPTTQFERISATMRQN